MNVLFAHDHKFIYDSSTGLFYTSGKFPYSVFKRYLRVFNNVFVAARSVTLNDNSHIVNLNVSSGPNLEFVKIPSLSNPFSVITSRPQAIRLIQQTLVRTDALIARVPSEIGLLAIEMAQEKGIPWAVEVVACPWDSLWNYGNIQGKLYAPIMWYRTRKAVNRAKFALYVSSNFLQRRYPCNGITTDCSNVELPDSVGSVLEKRLEKIGLGQNSLTIGMIASLSSSYKGVHTALHAHAALVSQFPGIRLKILGEGDPSRWRALAEALSIGDSVFFEGVLPAGEAVFNWLDQIDLYIQPSLQEGLPRALIEAMSRGCPALGSSAGGIPELLDGNCLFRPGDYHALISLMMKGCNDKNWQFAQAKRNFRIAANYSRNLLNDKRDSFWLEFERHVSKYVAEKIRI